MRFLEMNFEKDSYNFFKRNIRNRNFQMRTFPLHIRYQFKGLAEAIPKRMYLFKFVFVDNFILENRKMET